MASWLLCTFDDIFHKDTSSPAEKDPGLEECLQEDWSGETIEYHPHHRALGFVETAVFRNEIGIVVRVKTKKEGRVQK